jgi:hypothetical protein
MTGKDPTYFRHKEKASGTNPPHSLPPSLPSYRTGFPLTTHPETLFRSPLLLSSKHLLSETLSFLYEFVFLPPVDLGSTRGRAHRNVQCLAAQVTQ